MDSRYPHLSRLKIPQEVVHTDTLVKSLMRIAETKPFLDEYLGTPQEVKLLRKAKVRAIDYVERLIEDSRPLKVADMCDLQKLVTQGLIEERQCGRVRTIPVSIVNAATGEKTDECPQPHELKDLLDDLWRWVEDTKNMNPFARAFAFHFIAVSIHPFADGNGRTVRLMQHLLLLLGGQRLARFVPSETAIMRSRDRYHTAIRQSRRLAKPRRPDIARFWLTLKSRMSFPSRMYWRGCPMSRAAQWSEMWRC